MKHPASQVGAAGQLRLGGRLSGAGFSPTFSTGSSWLPNETARGATETSLWLWCRRDVRLHQGSIKGIPSSAIAGRSEPVELLAECGGRVRASRYVPRGLGVSEWHLVVVGGSLDELATAYAEACGRWGLAMETAVFRRLMVPSWQTGAERATRLELAGTEEEPVALSVVQQPVLVPAHGVALYAHHVAGRSLSSSRSGCGVLAEWGGARHLWWSPSGDPSGATAAEQMAASFEAYTAWLAEHGATLTEHAQRTWVFVADIDRDYQTVNAARREHFARHGLSPATHFIASTGIGGRCGSSQARVGLDAYAVLGLAQEQRQFVHAVSHLGPASAYGATFERGVSLTYGDRRHVWLSGTAAIDPTGTTMHVGDPVRQTERTLENVEALLVSAGAAFRHLTHAIVYLRDANHYHRVASVVRAQLPDLPLVFVEAAVCRPEWLVEIECAAITSPGDPRWGAF